MYFHPQGPPYQPLILCATTVYKSVYLCVCAVCCRRRSRCRRRRRRRRRHHRCSQYITLHVEQLFYRSAATHRVFPLIHLLFSAHNCLLLSHGRSPRAHVCLNFYLLRSLPVSVCFSQRHVKNVTSPSWRTLRHILPAFVFF